LRDGVIEGLRADVEANRSQYGNATKNLFAVQAQLASVTSELAVGQKREEDLKEKILLATRQVVQLRESAGAAQKMQEELVQLRQSQAQLFAMQQRVVNAEREGVECRKVTDELKVERDHLRGMVEDLVGNLSKSADGHG
jgi:chromosome segregation ATPase